MKKLVLLSFLFIAVSSFSQTMNIHVTKVQSFFGDTNQLMYKILSGSTDDFRRNVNCTYILDLNQNFVKFYKNNQLITQDPILVQLKDSVYQIKFLNEPINYGLIVDVTSNTCTLYEFNGSGVEYVKFIKFKIKKD